MLNMNFTKITRSKEGILAAAQTCSVEGLCMISIIETGEERVKASANGSSDKYIGFSYGEVLSPVTKSYVETVVVPSGSPYTVTLKHNNLVASNIFAYDNTNTQALTEGNPATTANNYSVVDATGIMTFHSGQAGASVTVTYRYSPTAQELIMEDTLTITTQKATDVLGQIGLAMGGEIYTDQYDAAVNWATSTTPEVGNAGIVTEGGSSAAIPNCTVIHVPTASNPFLGLRIL